MQSILNDKESAMSNSMVQ